MGGPSKPGIGRGAGQSAPEPRGRNGLEEQRASVRRPTFKSGEITNDDNQRLDCIVRNVSASGCMVKVEDADLVADNVRIRIDLDQPVRRAEVIWRSATLVGLMFIEEPH